MNPLITSVYICFFLSGAAGLIYEIVWIRMLGLIFGHTVFAVTTVLTAFMAGLALGSFLFGRLGDTRSRPLRVYGLLEGGIGIYCLFIPLLFKFAQTGYLYIYRQFDLPFFAFSLVQFALLFFILLIPTALMGGTLPVLSKFFVEKLERLGRNVGDLYALNTFGAVTGTLGAGFFFLPFIGMKTTILFTSTVNLVIAAFVILAERYLTSPKVKEKSAEEPLSQPLREDISPTQPLLALALFGMALSGAASMVYEIAWTRALILVIGSSTYAFSAMLTTFLFGLALGSFLFARLQGKTKIGLTSFGFLEVAIGFSTLLLLPTFSLMPDMVLKILSFTSSSYNIALLSQFFISFLVMIIPTTLIGATFPCLVQACTASLARLGRDIGRVYAANTLGTICGSFIAGFFLIPHVGIQSSLITAASTNVLAGAGIIMVSSWQSLGWRRFLAYAFLPLLAVFTYFQPAWDRGIMVSGVSVYGQKFLHPSSQGLHAETKSRKLLFYQEGINSTIAVEQTANLTSLKVDGKVDASNGADMLTQLMLGHLPIFLHPDPKTVLVIGLGSGVTAGAISQHPAVKEIDIVELEPAVIQASSFFTRENRDVLRDPRVRVNISDARNFILASRKRYDVISSEPSNPWMAGVANLFSLEFYQICREHLAEGGIMVQWVHGYSLFPRELKMIVNTFRKVFPHTTIWRTLKGDYLLLGTQKEITIDYNLLRTRYESSQTVQEDFTIFGWQSPLALLTLFLLDEEDTTRYAAGALENTDDLPLLEFSAPLALYAQTTDLNHSVLRAERTHDLPPIKNLDKGILMAPATQINFARALWAHGEREEALKLLDEMPPIAVSDLPLQIQRAALLFSLGRIKEATEELCKLPHLKDPLISSYIRAGRILMESGMEKAMVEHGRTKVGNLNSAEAHNNLGLFYHSLGMHFQEPVFFDLAIDAFTAALQIESQAYPVINNLGNAYFEKGMLDKAAAAYSKVIEIKPDLAETHFNLGLVYQNKGEIDLATREYELAVQLQPDWDLPRINLDKLRPLLPKHPNKKP